MKTSPKQPLHELRINNVKAAIWENETDAGVRYNATFRRIYKDGDAWRSSESFGRDDLLALAKVADLAHSWICNASTGKTPRAATSADPNP